MVTLYPALHNSLAAESPANPAPIIATDFIDLSIIFIRLLLFQIWLLPKPEEKTYSAPNY